MDDKFVKDMRDALEAVLDNMNQASFKRGFDILNQYDELLKQAGDSPTKED